MEGKEVLFLCSARKGIEVAIEHIGAAMFGSSCAEKQELLMMQGLFLRQRERLVEIIERSKHDPMHQANGRDGLDEQKA